MVILTLLGGLSVAVAAQDTEADPMAPAIFTFEQPVMERVMVGEYPYEDADELPQAVRGEISEGYITEGSSSRATRWPRCPIPSNCPLSNPITPPRLPTPLTPVSQQRGCGKYR